jgi:hypothetical protein
VHHSRSDFHDSNCCRSDRPKSAYHNAHNASHPLAPPAYGPTRSVSTLFGHIRYKDRNCITSFSDRTPRATLWRFLTADRHTDAAPCAQPTHHRVQRKDYAGSHVPRRWLRDRPRFSDQYNNRHSIIRYTTTDPDQPDYTLLSAHPLFRPLCPLTFTLLGGSYVGASHGNLRRVGNTDDQVTHTQVGIQVTAR